MTAVVQVSGVTKTFRATDAAPEQQVLRGVDLEIVAGDRLAIVGPSGCGKSTLLNLIGGLDQPDSGSIRHGDVDLASADDTTITKLRNERIGFIFQDHHLLPQCTVLENVLMPCLAQAGKPSAEQVAKGKELLDRVGLGGRHDDWPQHLSGGERQRVAVARSLIMQPALMLADEPTGALDEKTAGAIASLLTEVQEATGVALLVVTHSKDLAAQMATTYTLHGGQLETVGG